MPVILNEKMGDIPRFIKKNPSLNKTNSKQSNTEEEVISNDLPNKEIDKNTFSDNNWLTNLNYNYEQKQILHLILIL